jgi:hypothetical protein
MFIDGQQIGAFYNAVVGPAFTTVELQISAGRTERARARHAAGSAVHRWHPIEDRRETPGRPDAAD